MSSVDARTNTNPRGRILTEPETSPATENETGADESSDPGKLVRVHDLRPDGYEGTCLRPLGLCDLGGCCDSCWYSPDNPRFKKS